MEYNNLKTFNNDKFNREYIAENLTKILDSQVSPKVISIDSSWGTGKTTFITMWKNMLDSEEQYKDKFETFYFNAWENDYVKDPLLAIFSEIDLTLNLDDSKVKRFIDKSKKIVSGLSIFAIKNLTKNMLGLDDDSLFEAINTSDEKLDTSFVDEVSNTKNLRNELKQIMSEYQKYINKKVIFFIDELDRCRPNFAIELLEVIKHLFHIDNFIFIIAIDKEQLSYSIANIYGQNMDTEGYLRRFFDLDYTLPKISTKEYIDLISDDILKDFENTDVFEFFIKEFMDKKNFSLRDINKTYLYIKLLLPIVDMFVDKNRDFDEMYKIVLSYLYALLIVCKFKDSNIYKQILSGRYDVDEIKKQLNIIDVSNIEYLINYNFSSDRVQELIEDTLYKYLLLNYEFNNGMELSSEKYKYDYFYIGLKSKKTGVFLYNNSPIKLVNLFDKHTKKSIIHKNLEFIGNFNF